MYYLPNQNNKNNKENQKIIEKTPNANKTGSPYQKQQQTILIILSLDCHY